MELLLEYLKNNAQVAAAMTIVLGGLVSYISRDIPLKLWRLIKSQTTCSLEIDNTDDWNGKSSKISRFQTWYVKNGLSWLSRTMRMDSEGNYLAGEGNHYFIYKGRLFWFRYYDLDSSGVFFRKQRYVIMALTRNTKLIRQFIEEATYVVPVEKTEINVFAPMTAKSDDFFWKSLGGFKIDRQYTPLANSRVLKAVSDLLNRFETDRQWFIDNGSAVKRTIFFWGPPGTGKTSIVSQIARTTGRDIYTINFQAVNINYLYHFVSYIPPGSILLIEDIHSAECMLKNEYRVGQSLYNQTTDLTTVLNLLSGVVPLNDLIIVMTTNYKERIEPAVYRPGRVDLDIEVGYLTDDDIRSWLLRTYGSDAEQYKNTTFPNGITTGEVFRLYELHRGDHEALVGSLTGLEIEKPDQQPSQTIDCYRL